MKLIDQINESAIFSQSGYSADTATHDSLGNVIADTYISAVSASANISVTKEGNNKVWISGKDWTDEITAAANSAFTAATAQIPSVTPYSAGANIVINDHVISVDTAIELTDITGNRGAILDPSGLYVSDLDQSDYTEIGLDHVVSTDGSARIGWQLGNKEISVDVDSGNGDYAILHMSTADVMLEQRHPNPTPDAVYSLTGACQSAASAINMINSGDNTPYSAGANIDITDHVVSGKDWTTEIQAASAYAASQGGLEYEGVAPIVVNNVEHKISAQSALLGVQSPLYFVEDSQTATVIGISGLPDVQGVMYESGLGGTDGYVTGYNGSGFSATGGGNPQALVSGVGSVTIYKPNDTVIISGYDYTSAISAASAYAYSQATAHDPTGKYIPYNTATVGSAGTVAFTLNSGIRVTGNSGWVEIYGQDKENENEAHLQVAQNFTGSKSFWAEIDGISGGIIQMNWNSGNIAPNSNSDYWKHATACLIVDNGGITYRSANEAIWYTTGNTAWKYGKNEYDHLNYAYSAVTSAPLMRVVATTAEATGSDILYIVTGS